MILNEIKF